MKSGISVGFEGMERGECSFMLDIIKALLQPHVEIEPFLIAVGSDQ